MTVLETTIFREYVWPFVGRYLPFQIGRDRLVVSQRMLAFLPEEWRAITEVNPSFRGAEMHFERRR